MGVHKQYLRYKFVSAFNIIAVTKCNVIFADFNDFFVACSANDNILVWDLRKGEKVATLVGNGSEVTVIGRSPDAKCLVAGYEDGSISIFDINSRKNIVKLHGHTSPVNVVVYDNHGMRIASGSKDTDIVIWDTVSECGLFRLKGHKDIVTCCRFLHSKDILISSSKDTFMKFWDLSTQHCFLTVSASHSAIWDFVVTSSEDQLITCCGDNSLRIWNIQYSEEGIVSCSSAGIVQNVTNSPTKLIKTDKNGVLLACGGNSKTLEIYRLRPNANTNDILQRMEDNSVMPSTAVEALKFCGVLNTSLKIKSFDFFIEKQDLAKFVVLLSDGHLESYSVHLGSSDCNAQLKYALRIPGHETDVRTLCFSSDNTAILSASAESLKIWNRATQQCICTIACEYALCSLFVPGDRHCIIGTKTGNLQIIFIAGSELLETVKAHGGAVWSISLNPDQRSFISGGADGSVKFWDFTLTTSEQGNIQKLSIVHTRTLKLTDDVICVKFSKNGRLFAASLLDSTVKIFFSSSLKFFLSLYGHKFPVLCMDIADDNTLIATGSADRNIKIWGLDFGDCHKSIFAHDDSVMCLQFVPKTHMLFTGGKDGTVKQWDVDNFQRITTFKIHHAEVWALDVSSDGQHVVSSSHDKAICLLQKTNEILILEEEREIEHEQEIMKDVISKGNTVAESDNPTNVLNATNTGENLGALDMLLNALEDFRTNGDFRAHIVTSNIDQTANVTDVTKRLDKMKQVLKQIRMSEMKDVIGLLSFIDVVQLMKIFVELLKENWKIEFVSSIVFLLLRIHHGQVISNHSLLSVMDDLQKSSRTSICHMKDIVGFNVAGLRILHNDLQAEKDEVPVLFKEPVYSSASKKKLKRKKTLTKVLLSI